MDKCPVCGSKLENDAKACKACGTVFDSATPKCPLCGAEVDGSMTQCPGCGAELEELEDGDVPETDIEEVEIAETPSDAEKETAELIAKDVFVDVELEELVKLSGVGPLKAKILYDAGFTDLRKLKQASVVELMNIRGIGRKAAGEIKTALRESSLEEIRETEITRESVEPEYQCPLCGTVVSAYENSCYECGCIFEPGAVSDEDSDRLALSYYDSKLLRDPDNKELWYARGATLVKVEEYDQALNSFDRALAIDKSFQSAWMSKAEVYNKLGDPTKAAECYSHIITAASEGKAFGMPDDDTAGDMGETAAPEEPVETRDVEPEEVPDVPAGEGAELPPIVEAKSDDDEEEPEPTPILEEEPGIEEEGHEPTPILEEEPGIEEEGHEPAPILEEEPGIEEEGHEPAPILEEEPGIEEEGHEPTPILEEEPGIEEEGHEPAQILEEEPDIEEEGHEPAQILEEEPGIEEEGHEPAPIVEKYPRIDVVDEELDLEEEAPGPEPVIEEPEESPVEDIKPAEYPTGGMDLDMDYTRPDAGGVDLDSMSQAEMKKYLSKRASYVKPYLSLAKELEVDIRHAKRLIAKAVAESKKGDTKSAIQIMDEGISSAEDEFHKKAAQDMEELADVIRDLKVTGIDVSEAVDLVKEANGLLEDNRIVDSVEKMRKCLALVESLATG